MSPRLQFAIEIARRAGDATIPIFENSGQFELKSNQTPVTKADLLAETIIRKGIESEFPEDDILGEEQGGDEGHPNRWVIDPIDGTNSFVAGVPLFSTLLAYEENFVPQLGVAYFPALHRLIYAEIGAGTWDNGQKCKVMPERPMNEVILACGSHKSMEQRGLDKAINKLAQKAMATRTWGDAFGHMLVATGKIGAMIDPKVARWDISAMSIIVREAGGSFTNLSGDPELSNEALSAAPWLIETLLGALQQ